MAISKIRKPQQLLVRSLAVWLALICAEMIHGMLRGILLSPVVGEFRANQIGVFTGSVILILIACLTIEWIGASRLSEWLQIGCLWLLLTVGFEVLFGRLVIGLTWERLGSDYNLTAGGLMPLGLLVMFFSPLLAAKLRRSRS